jgi:hypothetical protein
MMKTTLLLVILFIVETSLSQITFQASYGGTDHDFGHSGQQTSDGGYAFFGQTHSFGNGSQDMYLIKTDLLGNELWSKTYGGQDFEFGISMMQTSDNGYVLCGSYSGLGNDSLAIIKTDNSGNVLWNKRFSGSIDRDVGQTILETTDGGFIAAGFTGPDFAEDIYIVKVDIDGNEEWNQVYPTAGREYAVSIVQNLDGSYVLFGETSTVGNGGADMYLLKITSTGIPIWNKTYGTSMDEKGRSVRKTSDGGYILIGQEYFQGGNIYVVKTDAAGNELWSNYYGDIGWDLGHDIRQTPDGGYIIAGRIENTTNGNHEMYCAKLDALGALTWENTYPQGIISDAVSVGLTNDGGYILVGSTTYSVGSDFDNDLYAVKIDGTGYLTIDDQEIELSSIQISPNPSNGIFNLDIASSEDIDLDIRVNSALGKEVLRTSTNGVFSKKIDLTLQESGVYFLTISSNSVPIAVKRIIKK